MDEQATEKNTLASQDKAITPHDALAKACLRDVTLAKSFLEVHLPPSLKKHCDLNTLSLQNSSFVEATLKQTHADVLYSLNVQGHSGYIYFLIEHQSSVDEYMPARMLRYQAAIAYEHFQKHKKFPTIVPILLYAEDKGPYTASCNLKDYLETPHISPEVLPSAFQLIDLTSIPYEALANHPGIELFELALKHRRNQQEAAKYILERGEVIVGYMSLELFRVIVEYITQVSSGPEVIQALTEVVSQPYKEDIMTYAQCLEEKGLQRGRQEGRQEGLQEGKLQVAKELLALGLDQAVIVKTTGLDTQSLAKLLANHIE